MLIQLICQRVSFSTSETISQLHFSETHFTIQDHVPPRIQFFGHSGPVYSPKLSVESTISITACRFSRTARTEAQVALFDYLHGTRGFPFTDAEQISKNSPQFLQYLLSKVDNERDLSLALPKFFLFNPINAFQPFLESSGLSPSELASFLPPNLMFLADDYIMLQNFRILCDFGIPRSKIGKLYKEANATFRYEDGILAMKLRAYEELGLSRCVFIKLVICCLSLLLGGVNMEFVGVLEKLKVLGFEKDWI